MITVRQVIDANGIEATIDAIAEIVKEDLEAYKAKGTPHEGVVACLEGCIEALRHASLAYYSSLK